MTDLHTTYQQIKGFHANGEAVAHRMAQLHDFSFVPTNEHLIPSVEQVLKIITLREDNLIDNDPVRSKKTLLSDFLQAMYDSRDEEWEEFKKEISLEPIAEKDTKRLLADNSGLVRNTGFEEWVISGEGIQPKKIEGQIDALRIVRGKEG